MEVKEILGEVEAICKKNHVSERYLKVVRFKYLFFLIGHLILIGKSATA